MSIRSIIQHFETTTGEIVWTSQVEEQILRRLSNVKVVRRAKDCPPERLRGLFVGRRTIPEPEGSLLIPLVECRIVYSSRQTLQYQRLVLTKELLHCLDDEEVKTSNIKDALALCDELTNGEDTIAPSGETVVQAAIDEMAKFQALAILFPMRVRRGFIVSYEADQITIGQIAERVQLPTEYVGMVMSDVWPSLYKKLAGTS